MNPKFLGDAKDFAKAAILDLLRRSNILGGGFRVLPLWTGAPKPADVATYARILGVPTCTVLLGTAQLPTEPAERDQYIDKAIAAAGCAKVLFLDPDKGVRMPPSKKTPSKKPPSKDVVDIAELASLSSAPGRVLIVYDESFDRAKPLPSEMQGKLQALGHENRLGFYYDGGSVKLLFCGASNRQAVSRLKAIRATLEHHLGPQAPRRIVTGRVSMMCLASIAIWALKRGGESSPKRSDLRS